jgi:hypothetical protein
LRLARLITITPRGHRLICRPLPAKEVIASRLISHSGNDFQIYLRLLKKQKVMRHSDIRTTLIYGDVVDGGISQALEKVSALIFANSTRGILNHRKNGSSGKNWLLR